MTKNEAAELLDLIVNRAPKLRDAGVLSGSVGELTFALAPAEKEAAGDGDDDIEDIRPRNPLFDSDTFGGKKVPGKQKRGDS